MDFPRLREPFFWSVGAAFFIALAWRGERLPDWLRLFLAALGLICASYMIISLINFLTFAYSRRLQDVRYARVESVISLARSLQGLPAGSVDLVAGYSHVIATGMVGDRRVLWSVQGLTQRIPLEFIFDFLQASEETYPYMFPIREGYSLFNSDGKPWRNAKQLAGELVGLLIDQGWADKSKGPYSAKLLVPIREIAEEFGLEA